MRSSPNGFVAESSARNASRPPREQARVRRRGSREHQGRRRLSVAFGRVLARFRAQRKLTSETLALAGGFSGRDEVESMEHGHREPALSELFRIAKALGEPPGLLFIDVVDAWRADPTHDAFYKTRASDFARLYRLGYYEAPRDFREQQRTYTTLDEATATAGKLNCARHSRRLKLLDTVCIYIRTGHVSFTWKSEPSPSRPTDEMASVAEIYDRITASIEDVRAVVARYEERPAESSRAALDELGVELRRLRCAFGMYEIDVDRISDQLTQADLEVARAGSYAMGSPGDGPIIHQLVEGWIAETTELFRAGSPDFEISMSPAEGT
jgi:transcriptional regulator with XRE-family HTH domain